jgi:hypothetical protein
MTPKTAALLADPHPQTHIVYPYTNFAQAVPVVGRYLNEGIARGESIVLIVTDAHRHVIAEQLHQTGVDIRSLEKKGRILFVDAVGSIEKVISHDGPDPAGFDRVVGSAIRQGIANAPAGKVRVYGEMVNELCSTGRAEAAARMEELWNTLDEARFVPVLCSYSLETLLPLGEDVRNRILHAHDEEVEH